MAKEKRLAKKLRETAADREPDGAAILKTRKKDATTPAFKLKPRLFKEQLIRDRAYAIWISEGQPDGRDLEHWLRAAGEVERDAA